MLHEQTMCEREKRERAERRWEKPSFWRWLDQVFYEFCVDKAMRRNWGVVWEMASHCDKRSRTSLDGHIRIAERAGRKLAHVQTTFRWLVDRGYMTADGKLLRKRSSASNAGVSA
jgi:hypothetical protein